MKAHPPLVAFNAGELSPELDGRTDLDKYSKGCRTLENFLPLVQGGAMKRSGFRFVKPVQAETTRALQSHVELISTDANSGSVGDTYRISTQFRPKAVIGINPSNSFAFATSPTSRFMVAADDRDNADPTAAFTQTRNDSFTQELNVSGAGASTGRLDIESIDDSGITLVIDQGFLLGTKRHVVMALGGPAIRNAKIVEFDCRSSAGSQAITGAGFAPDVAIFLGGINTALSTSQSNAGVSFGAAVKGPPILQYNSVLMSQHNVGTSNTARRASSAHVLGIPSSTTLSLQASCTSFDADGVTLTFTGSGTSSKCAVLLMETRGAFTLAQFLTSTSIQQVTVSGFAAKPKCGLLIGHGDTAAQFGTVVTHQKTSVGAYSEHLQSVCSSVASIHGGAAADVLGSQSSTATYLNLSTAGGFDGAFTVVSTDSDRFVYSQTDGDPTEGRVVWGLFGSDARGPAEGPAMLVPFSFSEDDASVIEFGDGYVSFHRENAPVYDVTLSITGATATNPVVLTVANLDSLQDGDEVYVSGVGGMTQLNGRWFILDNPNFGAGTVELKGVNGTGYSAYTSGGTVQRVYRIASPYYAEDLSSLQWRGQSDVLYIASPNHPPMKLSRYAVADWLLEEVEFEHFPFASENDNSFDFIAASGTTGTITLTSSEGRFSVDAIGEYIKLREIPEAFNPEWKPAPEDFDATKYKAFQANLTTFAIGDRLQYEGRVYEVARRGASGVMGSVPPTHDSGWASDGTFDFKFINYGYGYARLTNVADRWRATAQVVVPIPKSCVSADRGISSLSTGTPIVVTMLASHEWETGDLVFFTGVDGTFGDFVNGSNFTITRLSATTFSIPLSGSGLTGGGGFAIRMNVASNATGTNGKIYPSLFRWSWGAWGPVSGYPKTVAFFEDRLCWAGTRASPQGLWMSRVGRYEDHAVFDEDDTAMAVTLAASDPIQWMLEANAIVLGTSGSEFASNLNFEQPLTPENVHTIRSRSRAGSRAGVAPVGVDSVILMAQRAGRKLLEVTYDESQNSFITPDLTRLADHITIPLIKQMVFQREPNRVVWIVLEDGQLIGFTYEREEQVAGFHRHPLGGVGVKVKSLAVIPHPDGDGDQLWAVIERTIGGQTVWYVERLEKGWVRGTALADALYVDSAATYSGAPATVIGGLWHLVGETVRVLADGVYAGEFVVSAGASITLPSAASKVHVGLPYSATLAPMRLEAGAADGTAQGKTKRISNVVVRLGQTGRGLYLGDTPENATEEIAIADGVLHNGDTPLRPFPGRHDFGGLMALRHTLPTPCTVTAIYPKVNTEDR